MRWLGIVIMLTLLLAACGGDDGDAPGVTATRNTGATVTGAAASPDASPSGESLPENPGQVKRNDARLTPREAPRRHR